jgi:hypothetical protein
MFSSDWLHKSALGGCIALALFVSLVSALAQTPKQPSGATEQQPSAAKQPDANETRPAPATKETNAPKVANPAEVPKDDQSDPPVYKSACGDTKDHNQADLCEQKRMSGAAERAADYAYRQLYISGIGLGIVAVSLWFAGIGAFAARDAARTSIKQGDAIIRAERPFVFVKVTKPGLKFAENGMIIPETDGRLQFEFVNYGRTPALLEEFMEAYPVVEGITDAPVPVDPMKSRGRMLPVGTVAATGAPYTLRTKLFTQAPDIRKMLDKDAWKLRRIFFQGFIRYSDAFGNYYITGFLEAFSPIHGEWALRGDEKHNYSRQERPEDVPPHPDYVERPDPDSEKA